LPLSTRASAARHLRQTVPEHPLAAEPMAGIAAWVEVHQRILRFTAMLPRRLGHSGVSFFWLARDWVGQSTGRTTSKKCR
jgi:hypothetical protein